MGAIPSLAFMLISLFEEKIILKIISL